MSSAIVIPNRVNELLGQSPLAHAVRQSVQDFEAWIGDPTKGLFFFPEYSDHSPKHISAVLAGAEALIREEAWPHLTPEDAAVLVLATLLHDSAMHLMADGFLELIDQERGGKRPLIPLLDEKTWPQLFEQFYLEARRWDQRKLHKILGDQEKKVEEEEDLVIYIRQPKEMPDPEDWSVRYRKFLGEFIRRHHARLAHEIAKLGVPGCRSLTLTRVSSTIADLAGLVARSHNMHLRDTFLYLKERHYSRVACSNSHPVFLMTLLRIADYLEIRSDRVNPTLQDLQRLRSPISQEEWNAHLAVHEVRPDDEDREAIFVVANPPSARTFLKLQGLLQGLQAELDTSWAVLGEIFSLRLPQLGLTLRRVRSNIDDVAQFMRSEDPPYVPIRAAFDSAGAELLKLLIRPLYGNRPDIGIRELLQNALDAVHELRQWASDQGDPEMKSIPLPEQSADVLISIDKNSANEHWLTISDKGIGMNADVVRGYFLKAGASYRQSDAWRKAFEGTDGAKVFRSGRFGIGALSVFLLGDRIDVSTRHVTSTAEDALHFSASLADDYIEIERHNLSYVGTTIRIRLRREAEALIPRERSVFGFPIFDKWDWYTSDRPVVERRLYGTLLPQTYYIPSPWSTKKYLDWKRFTHRDYEAIYWSHKYLSPKLTCNGIMVNNEHPAWKNLPEAGPLEPPAVAVFDRNGKLPLTLQRNGLETKSLPFLADLIRDVAADLCAYLLVYSPKKKLAFSPPWWSAAHMRRPQSSSRSLVFLPICYSAKGTLLLHPWFLKKARVRRALLIEANQWSPSFEIPYSALGSTIVILCETWSHSVKDYILENLDGPRRKIIEGIQPIGSRLLIPPGRLPAKHLEAILKATDIKTKNLSQGWKIIELGQTTQQGESALAHVYEKNITAKPAPIVIEWQFEPDAFTTDDSIFTQVVEETMDGAIIPFKMNDRLRKFPKAFSALRDYIATQKEHHRRSNDKQSRSD